MSNDAPNYFTQTSYKQKSTEAEESLIEFISRVLNSESIKKNKAEDTLKNLKSFRNASILIADLVFKNEETETGSDSNSIKIEDITESNFEKDLSFSFGQIEDNMDNFKVKRENPESKVIFKDLENLSKAGTLELRVLFHLLPILDSTISCHIPLFKIASLSVSDFGAFLLQGLCYIKFKNYFCHILTSLKLASEMLIGKISSSRQTQEASFSGIFSRVSERIKSCDPSDDRVLEFMAFIHPDLQSRKSLSTYFLNLTPVVIKLIGAGHHYLPNATLFVFEMVFEVFHYTQDVQHLEVKKTI